jgi:Protein of unknown function (DUF3577)
MNTNFLPNLTTQATVAKADDVPGYYDCHTYSLCYINDVYERQEGRKSAIETWVNLSLVQGEKDDPSYVKCNVRVVGTEAALLMDQLKPFANERNSNKRSVHKVMARVVLGDTFPLIITAKQGKNAGEVYPIIKGRLLRIDWARVKTNDNVVFEHRAEKVNKGAEATPTPNAEQPDGAELIQSPVKPQFKVVPERNVVDATFTQMPDQDDAQFDERLQFEATGTDDLPY